jgi:uncharacterized membrane protein SirB2
MDAGTLYLPLRHAHIALVTLSGTLFALRGAAVWAGQAWAMRPLWRRLTAAIDTLLLAAGVGLWTVLQLNPVASPWLGVKLLLLPVYIVLGTLALKRGRTPAIKRAAYVAALAVLLFMVTVARSHDPLGALRGVSGLLG